MEKHFDNWEYQAVQELERLASALPILPRERASAFFKEARKATGGDGDPVERRSGKIFDSLRGVVSASDRKDFAATWDIETQSVAQGVLMVETYDSVIGTLFCVARVSQDSFLTRGYTQKNKESVKGLRTTPAQTPPLAPVAREATDALATGRPEPAATTAQPNCRTIEARGESFRLALDVLKTLVPDGYAISSQKTLDQGESSEVTGSAATLDEARDRARAKIPPDVTFKSESPTPPSREVVEVTAFGEDEARVAASKKAGLGGRVENLAVKRGGSKGILGLGKRPTLFEAVVVKDASVRIDVSRPAHVSAVIKRLTDAKPLISAFWKDGGPFRSEFLSDEQEAAFAGLVSFGCVGDAEAQKAVADIAAAAERTLTDSGELAAYHGYQRQQVAAEILGLTRDPSKISALEAGRRLQEREGGRSASSNHTTISLVERAIEGAIVRLRSAK